MPKADELAREQAYLNHARQIREQKRELRLDGTGAKANGHRRGKISNEGTRLSDSLGSPDAPVAIGRVVDSDMSLYIGHASVRADDGRMLVINWKLPAAEPYFKANHQNPLGLRSKRTFKMEGHKLVDFEEVVFKALARQVAALESTVKEPFQGPDGSLLQELDYKRSGEMRDIVRTIQAAQYELITAPMDQVLVIQGGPGTGKTAIAMHRVSWLLYNLRQNLAPHNVLVVGPNRTFTRYIKGVLPSLGDHDVRHVTVADLAPSITVGRAEKLETIRLKGEARMSRLIRRALSLKVSPPTEATVDGLRVGARPLRLTVDAVNLAFRTALDQRGPYAIRRRSLADTLSTLIHHEARDLPAAVRETTAQELTERMWPRVTAAGLLRELFATRERLSSAGEGDFSDEELSLLHRRPRTSVTEEVWSQADLALLDEADHLIQGEPNKYGLIVVDEAQDLSAMQLRSIARRSSSGAITLVGDIAQSTGASARDSWKDVLANLPRKQLHKVEELKYGYRVPRQVYEFAAPLLTTAAPEVAKPAVVRIGPADPGLHHVTREDRARTAVRMAQSHAGKGRFVGIVCADSCRAEVERELNEQEVDWRDADQGELGSSINVVSPHGAKGLEFDSVIVVEPAEIVQADPRGERLLYIALTRTTKYLEVIYADPAVRHLNLPAEPVESPREKVLQEVSKDQALASAATSTPAPVPVATRPIRSRPTPLVESIAQALADELRQKAAETVKETIYAEVVRRAAELLAEPEAEQSSDGS
ncbi:UvrD-helicase domain-containing protein [Planosporangium mesophilum]|uniref:DNA helicase n=1 Tax=Planosporangium mesophilum TaxID=689768 RepID=A0A8J3TG91_9ACTN|nr:UvrD-helicase domain-containing protein [Planosporangium mesophilum]NJC86204.1 AAA family ATPase [Planosporangium mesophilum]GII25704.1 DNA helicase [Planosporangium mesophilum]